MRHLIVGMGNLGTDLAAALKAVGDVVIEWSPRSSHPIEVLKSSEPDFVWITGGAGSVGEAKKDFRPFLQLHINLVNDFVKAFNVPVICFSTDYAAGPDSGASLYALSKMWMEDLIKFYGKNRNDVFAIRVGSLYGAHYPERTFPYKLLKNYPAPTEVKLPANLVTPTPTAWLAEVLAENYPRLKNQYASQPILELAPFGSVSILDWGKIILGEKYSYSGVSLFDKERPMISELSSRFHYRAPNWKDLWDKYYSREIYGNTNKP